MHDLLSVQEAEQCTMCRLSVHDALTAVTYDPAPWPEPMDPNCTYAFPSRVTVRNSLRSRPVA